MKNKRIHKLLGIVLTLALVCSLGLVFMAAPVAADPDPDVWDEYDVPLEGADSDYLWDGTLDGGYAGPMDMAINGDLYIAVNDLDADGFHDLLRSTDGGRTWAITDYGAESDGNQVVDIACSSEDEEFVYVCDVDSVFYTDDSGATWYEIAGVDLATEIGADDVETLDVGYMDGDTFVFVGTQNGALGGSVYFIQQFAFSADWTDLNLVGYFAGDVWTVNVAPNFEDVGQVFCLITGGTGGVDTEVVTTVGVVGEFTQFGTDLLDDGGVTWVTTAASDICFPDDYEDSDDECWVGVEDAGIGGIYELDGSPACCERITDVDADGDFVSLDLNGNMGSLNLIAGDQDANNVIVSVDDGDDWAAATKQPSGTNLTYVLMSDDFEEDTGEAWASTAGAELSFSRTITAGNLWNGISLVGTAVFGLGVIDYTHSDDWGDSGVLFLLTTDAVNESVWRYDGEYWERVAEEDTVLAMTANPTLIEASPDYSSSGVVYLGDQATPEIWVTDDEGESWAEVDCQPTNAFDVWVVIDETTLVMGYTVAFNALVAINDDAFDKCCTEAIDTGVDTVGAAGVTDLDFWGDYVVIATDNGEVAVSDELGEAETWAQAGADGDMTAAADTYATFDTDFADNWFLYAGNDNDIYRINYDEDTAWTDIANITDIDIDNDNGGGIPQAALASGIVCADGVLYVSNEQWDQAVDEAAEAQAGGVERSVNPDADVADIVFERVADQDTAATGDFNLDIDAALGNLGATGGSVAIWAVDATNGDLWWYEDELIGPVVGLLSDCGDAANVVLTWDELGNDVDWDLMVYSDEDFRAPYEEYDSVTGVNPDIAADPVALLVLNNCTEYWWKVRVSEPLLSRFSDYEAVAATCVTGAGLLGIDEYTFSPTPGDVDVPLNPSFGWVNLNVDSYDFEFSDVADFSTTLDSASIVDPTYNLPITLDYNTNYFWRARPVCGGTAGLWAYATFTTLTEPAAPTPPADTPDIVIPPAEEIAPKWIYAIIGIGATLAGLVIGLIVKTRRT